MQFDNRYSRLPQEFFSKVEPTPLKNPFLLSWNRDLAEEMGLSDMTENEAVDYFGRMKPLRGGEPIAAVYAGHQFGHYVSQLGDGRSILLGELVTDSGTHWDMHLKGGGQTPYSRGADGRAVLRSTIREYLCSEAMHNLGIPTTRALAIVGSEEEVYRESLEYGATLLRAAPSHVRFGSFEYFYYRQDFISLQKLLAFMVKYHFLDFSKFSQKEQALAFFESVVMSTAELIAQWQLVGFAHGVMNSDNMSVLGLTIDYGPYGFLDRYDPAFICNHSDHSGRYAFEQQPEIALWNCRCLGQALLPLVVVDIEQMSDAAGEHAASEIREVLAKFQPHYEQMFEQGVAKKLGLKKVDLEQDGGSIATRWFNLLQNAGMDYSRSFRLLAKVQESVENEYLLREMVLEQGQLSSWLAEYRVALAQESTTSEQRSTSMNCVNPKYVLRNYMAENAIKQAVEGDYSEVENLAKLLRYPYAESPEYEKYFSNPPEWAAAISVSCSS